MVYTCFICKWRSNKEPRRSFHKFPTDKDRKQKWLDAIGRSDTVVGARTSICSLHFASSCFRYGLICGKELLKKDSVPSLNSSTNQDICLQTKNNQEEVPVGTCDNKVGSKRVGELLTNEIPDQNKYVDVPTVKTCTKNLPEYNNLQILVNQRNSEILSLQRQVRRMQRNALNLKTMNRNLRIKIKDLEQEVKLLRVHEYDYCENQIKKSKFHTE